jgi:hypothetical protein
MRMRPDPRCGLPLRDARRLPDMRWAADVSACRSLGRQPPARGAGPPVGAHGTRWCCRLPRSVCSPVSRRPGALQSQPDFSPRRTRQLGLCRQSTLRLRARPREGAASQWCVQRLLTTSISGFTAAVLRPVGFTRRVPATSSHARSCARSRLPAQRALMLVVLSGTWSRCRRRS